MSGAPSPPVDALEPAGWSHNGKGEITEGRPQGKGGWTAYFKHTRALQAKDVWRMRVEVGGNAYVGFATEHYNAEKHWETHKSTAWVHLRIGTTDIFPDISQDGQHHSHHNHLGPHIPEAPFDLAVHACAVKQSATFLRFNSTTTMCGTTLHRAGPH